MSEKKKNVPLIVALSIPILMVVLIAISIYIPTLFIKPQFDFLYTFGRGYCYDYNRKYSVQNGKVIENEMKKFDEKNPCHNYDQREQVLYYYDVQTNKVREIAFAEVQSFIVDNQLTSPDGFEVVSGDRSFDMFFFSSSSYYAKYLKKGAFSRKLNISGGNRYDYDYNYNFNFIGWIKE